MINRQKAVKYLLLTVLSFCAGIAGAISLYRVYIAPKLLNSYNQAGAQDYVARRAGYMMPQGGGGANFVKTSEIATPCVVYIKTQSEQRMMSFWDPFGTVGQVSASGSGVILSSDGYIVTNSHVVKNAQKIQVILNHNKKSFAAKVIGSDASSDLALLKIDATDLPHITFANSDDLPIGEWVLAVGNPFNLTSTVTAGIVSAKGRNLNITHNQFPIESFIQTDAAINPGNSGGALVNMDGNLVGINSAIVSETGSYAGYGFAIPSNIVKKVVNDLKEFGVVQRAFIEADVVDIDENIAGTIVSDNVSGVYVRNVIDGGNADKAGLKKGDIIIKINDKTIEGLGQFQEQLAYRRPGDKITVVVLRGSQAKELKIDLTNLNGTSGIEKNNTYHSEVLGADLTPISKLEMQRYGVSGGIRISNMSGGQLSRFNIQDGFVITSLNGKSYTDPKDLESAFQNAGGSYNIQGVNPDGSKAQFYYSGY